VEEADRARGHNFPYGASRSACYLQTAASIGSIISLPRGTAGIDPTKTFLVVNTNIRRLAAGKDELAPILKAARLVKAIDEAAAAMYAAARLLLRQDIPVQGYGREAYRS